MKNPRVAGGRGRLLHPARLSSTANWCYHQEPPGRHEHMASGVTCALCSKTFASKSTYGRHLDVKRGDASHPEPAVDELRRGVVRRAQEKAGPAKVDLGRAARSRASKTYNSKDTVKAANRARRRQRDVRLKAELAAHRWFVAQLGQSGGDGDAISSSGEVGVGPRENLGPGFGLLVALHVAPQKWPREVPSDPEFSYLLAKAPRPPSDILRSFEAWKKLPASEQLRHWRRDMERAVRAAAGEMCLADLALARETVALRLAQLEAEYLAQDMMDMLVSDD